LRRTPPKRTYKTYKRRQATVTRRSERLEKQTSTDYLIRKKSRYFREHGIPPRKVSQAVHRPLHVEVLDEIHVEEEEEDDDEDDDGAAEEAAEADDADDDRNAYINKKSAGGSSSRGANANVGSSSTRVLNADIQLMDANYLGQAISTNSGQIKAAVIRAAVEGGNLEPKFNKYSGIIEWANCIFLMVNIHGDATDINLFSDGGRHMSWLAQQTQQESAPVLQKMIHNECPVLLFCRPIDSYYLYLGKVKYVSHKPSTRPIQFVLELLDQDALVSGSHGGMFKKMFSIA